MTEPRNRRGLGIRFAAAAALIIGTIGFAALPAQATSVTGYGSGTVGVTQVINVTDGCMSSGSQVSFVASYSNGVTSSSEPVWANSNGNATLFWTPSIAGTVTSASIGSSCSPVSLGGANIAQVGTTTSVNAPNNAQVGVSTKIQVTVRSNGQSSYDPTGTVVVKDINGATLQTMGLTPGNGGSSYAYYWWTPSTTGSFTFQATYSGDANANAGSPSPQDVTIVTPNGNPISLVLPPTMNVGTPTTLKANVWPSSVQGTVGFTQNGSPISASVPIVNGVATYTWTPTIAGRVQIGANYMTNQGGSGSTSEAITVNSGPVATDVITLTQVGVGPWAPNGTYTLGGGTYQFTATSLSGAQVRVGESGPCSWSGYTLTVPTGGQCNIQAATNGANGYAPVSQGYTVTAGLGTQTAALAAPNSGKVNYKKVIKLETPDQGVTNANQTITWSVAPKSKKVCTLAFPSDGSVHAKFKARGYCTVTARADGIPGQWAPFVLQRTYQGA